MTRRYVLVIILASLVASPRPIPGAALKVVPNAYWLLFTPSGTTIITANGFNAISLRDGITGAEYGQLRLASGIVDGLALSPDGKTLAIGCSNGEVQLWRLPDGTLWTTLYAHRGTVATVAFSANGKTLASAGTDGIRIWDTLSGKELKAIPVADASITGLAFAPDGKTLASGGTCLTNEAGLAFVDSDRIRLWDVNSGNQRERLPIKGHGVGFSSDGRTVIVGGAGVYQVRPGEQANIVVNRMAFRTMNRVSLWDVTANKEVAAVENLGNAFALSTDGRVFAVCRGSEGYIQRHQGGGIRLGMPDNSRTLTVRESLTGQVIHAFPTPEGALAVALSPDGAHLAVLRPDRTVAVLDVTPKGDKHALDRPELKRLWSHLGGTEAGPAFAAVWLLAGAPEQSVPFFRLYLAPVKWDRTNTKKFIDDLDSEEFAVREAAAKELRRMGSDTEAELRQRLKTEGVSAEVARAIKELLEAVEGRSLPPEELQAIRAIHALERARTADARALLTELAGGEPEARLTREAKLALGRIGGR